MIDSFHIDRALADLGASINVMSSTMCKMLGLRNPTPIRMSVSLVDRSLRHPKEVVEDILIKVKDFVFSMGFVILDMEKDVDFLNSRTPVSVYF